MLKFDCQKGIISRIGDMAKNITLYKKRLDQLRSKIYKTNRPKKANVRYVLDWLGKKRKVNTPKIKIVPITRLTDWAYFKDEGVVRHNRGADHFFSVQGVVVQNALTSEISGWNQPIIVQQEGGYLVILCQEKEGTIKFLLQGKFEAGNIGGVQLGPSIQATMSNLKQHHSGRKPLMSEFINNPQTTIIYSAKHNEEGSRFWQKSNVNRLVLLKPNTKLPIEGNDNFIWLTLPEIKALMLHDNVVNPFVKTILSPL